MEYGFYLPNSGSSVEPDALAKIGFGLEGMSTADLARAEGTLVDLRREAGDF